MSKDTRRILLFALPLIGTVLLSYALQALIVSHQEEFTIWLSSFGPFVIVIYIILQAITLIIAPIGGFFLVIAMIALFGPAIALTLAYIVATPCYLLNFYLSRRYGRPLAQKIVGKENLKKMDRFVDNAGVGILVILRLFQSTNFDYFSYAFGLTKISPKTFTLVNFIVGIPAAFIAYIIYSRTSSLTQGVILGYIVSIFFIGISLLLSYLIRKKSRSIPIP